MVPRPCDGAGCNAAAPGQARSAFEELDGFIEAQAQAAVWRSKSVSVLGGWLGGACDWHVIDGSKIEPGVHGHEAHIRSAVRGTLSDQPVRLVGFFSIKHHTIFTHHDTDTHGTSSTPNRRSLARRSSGALTGRRALPTSSPLGVPKRHQNIGA